MTLEISYRQQLNRSKKLTASAKISAAIKGILLAVFYFLPAIIYFTASRTSENLLVAYLILAPWAALLASTSFQRSRVNKLIGVGP